MTQNYGPLANIIFLSLTLYCISICIQSRDWAELHWDRWWFMGDLLYLPRTFVWGLQFCDLLLWSRFILCTFAPLISKTLNQVDKTDKLYIYLKTPAEVVANDDYRIAVTLVSDPAANLSWRDVREVVIGRIRNTREYKENESGDMSVLSLNILPGQYMSLPKDDRYALCYLLPCTDYRINHVIILMSWWCHAVWFNLNG